MKPFLKGINNEALYIMHEMESPFSGVDFYALLTF